VNDYTKLYSDFHVDVSSSLYQSLDAWNGFDLIFELELCNILAWDLFVQGLEVAVSYDDMDGVTSWWGEAYAAEDGISLVSTESGQHTFTEEDEGFRMVSGKCDRT
jgi:hypothetical protein